MSMSKADEARRLVSEARRLMREDATASLPLFERVAFLADRSGDRTVQADAELGWGEALLMIDGQESSSLIHLNRAASLAEHTTIEALAWLTMGDVWHFYQDAERALFAFGKSASLFLELADVTGELLARQALAQTLEAMKRDEDALPQLRRAVQLSLIDDGPKECAELRLSLGELLLRLGEKQEATQVLSAAAEAFQQLAEPLMEARARSGLLGISWPETDYVQIIRLTELHIEQAVKERDAEREAILRDGLARLLIEQAEREGDDVF